MKRLQLRRLAQVLAGQSPTSDLVFQLGDSPDSLPFLQGNAEFGNRNPVARLVCDSAARRCEKNDLLLSVRAPVGALNIADREYGIGRGLCAVRAQGAEPRFLWWALHAARPQLAAVSVGSTFDAVTADDVLALEMPSQPLEVQRAIADYLDTETARIDALIAKKERMIELIEMRRKVVVVEHVSGHGSDGGVRLRHVSRLVRGSGFPHEYQGLDEGDLPFFKVGDLSRPGNDPYLVSCGNWVSTATANSLRATVVPPGAVMFPKIGAALAGGVRRIATVPCVCDNNVLAVVPTGVEERYLRFWLSTVDLAEIANPGPVPSLDDDALRDLLVPVADRERQREIADRLDVASASMSNAVTRLQSQIGLLRERRQGLITSAVTGEFEVPGVAA